MGMRKRKKADGTSVAVLQMEVEIPEEIHDKFMAKIDEDSWIDLPATVMNDKGEVEKIKIRMLRSKG